MKFPDYKYSNLNLVHSLLHYYGVKTDRNGLEEVDELLNSKKYKKVVLLIMDGMGHYNLINHNPNSFLCQKDRGPISTIYPSTTVAVMTMYESAMPVFESGWVSWSTYFKSLNRSIDVFTGRDSLSQELVNYPYKDLIKYESIYIISDTVGRVISFAIVINLSLYISSILTDSTIYVIGIGTRCI